jgi:hypothetical protein
MNGSLNDGSQPPRRLESDFPGAPALAFTFITVGAAYAFPFLLFSEKHPLNGPISPEILNLNLLVAWMGLAHFVFAYSGQAKSLLAPRVVPKLPLLFCGSLVFAGVLLALFHKLVGAVLFDAVIWVYFIPHFIKAELHFARASQPETATRGEVVYWFPALGFAYFTAALFAPLTVSFHTEILLAGAAICIVAGLMGGILRQLSQPAHSTYVVLGFFFVGEGLVWGAYSKYMTPQFRHGLYVFHIAVASFYHYFRAYAFALRRLPAARVRSYLHLTVLINFVLILVGCWIAWHPDWRWAQPLFGLSFFTFWVGLHLISSDIFTALKKFRQPVAGAAQ